MSFRAHTESHAQNIPGHILNGYTHCDYNTTSGGGVRNYERAAHVGRGVAYTGPSHFASNTAHPNQGGITPIGTVCRAVTVVKMQSNVKALSGGWSNGQAVFWALLLVIKRHGRAFVYAQLVAGQPTYWWCHYGKCLSALLLYYGGYTHLLTTGQGQNSPWSNSESHFSTVTNLDRSCSSGHGT